MVDTRRRAELMLDRVTVTALDGETPDEAAARWWRENADRVVGARTFDRPVIDVVRSL